MAITTSEEDVEKKNYRNPTAKEELLDDLLGFVAVGMGVLFTWGLTVMLG